MNSGKGGNNPLPFSLPLTLAIMGPKRIRYLILTSIVIGLSLLYYHFGFRIWDFEFKDPQSARPTFMGAPNPQSKGARVIKVIDGDTIEIKGSKLIRYIGINAPEIDMPFYKEATQKNKTLVEGKRIRLEVCKPEPWDRHGRILAWVYTDNTLVNAELLKEGLARTFIIPPCGLERAD